MLRINYGLVHTFTKLIFFTGIIVLFSCSEDNFNFDHDQGTPEEQTDMHEYLVESSNLGSVSATTIKLTAQLAGYPQFKSYFRYPIVLYKVVYHTHYMQEPILASGIISIPVGMPDSIPSMVIGNGLIFANEDAPSEFSLPDHFTGFEFVASAGYVAMIPDMIGFGVSKELLFPIHNYEYSAQTMIDFIHACDELIRDIGIPVSSKRFMTGYSQGGYIAMSALKMIEEENIQDIHISATAVGAGGYNLVSLLHYAVEQNSYSAPSHLIALFSSYNEIYGWNRPMTDFFQEPYAGRIPELLSGELDREQIDGQLAFSFDSLLNPAFLQDLKNNNEPELLQALKENSVDNWAPQSPLLIIHSVNDDRIPVSDSRDAYEKMVENGSERVELITIDTVGHINAGLSFIEMAINWFDSMLL